MSFLTKDPHFTYTLLSTPLQDFEQLQPLVVVSLRLSFISATIFGLRFSNGEMNITASARILF